MDIFDPTNLVCGALLAALALVGGATFGLARDKAHGGLDLRWKMGSPAWDFSQSWASNITVGAAVLGLAMTSLIAPYAPKTDEFARTYITLNVFFVILSAAAPCLYNAWRHGSVGPDNKLIYQGYVGMFLLSAVLTAWAVYGQLAAFWALASDACLTKLLACSMVNWMHVLIGGIASVLVPFLVQTIYWVVRSQRTVQATRDAFRESAAAPAPWPLL